MLINILSLQIKQSIKYIKDILILKTQMSLLLMMEKNIKILIHIKKL